MADQVTAMFERDANDVLQGTIRRSNLDTALAASGYSPSPFQATMPRAKSARFVNSFSLSTRIRGR